MSEIIVDPTFFTLVQPDSKWIIVTHHGVVMKPFVEDSVLRLDINHTSGANWHGELLYAPFAVAQGKTLSVSFAARARTPFLFSTWLGQKNAPYQSLVSPENHFGEKMMTAEWQTFTHVWNPIVNEPEARLDFVLGRIDNVVELKEISLRK